MRELEERVKEGEREREKLLLRLRGEEERRGEGSREREREEPKEGGRKEGRRDAGGAHVSEFSEAEAQQALRQLHASVHQPHTTLHTNVHTALYTPHTTLHTGVQPAVPQPDTGVPLLLPRRDEEELDERQRRQLRARREREAAALAFFLVKDFQALAMQRRAQPEATGAR